MLLSGRTALYLHGDGHENKDFSANKDRRGPAPIWAASPLQLHQCVWFQFSAIPLGRMGGKKKKMFLNVCFKDSSSAFQVFGCFFLCVKVHSFPRTFASPKKKKRQKKTLCSEFNTLGWRTYHYSQIGRNKLSDFSRPKTENPSFFSDFVNFAPSCCAIISVVASFGRVICFLVTPRWVLVTVS